MPDLWLDVDAAVVVPVNLFPLIDDTDFKTIEEAVVYNSAGMDLVWNFVPAAGTLTSTAVTPTTGSSYDWSEPLANKGMYAIEIPASAGEYINNDTEGVGWFTGVADGVLPWRSPLMLFRAAGLNNALMESAWNATQGLAGTDLDANIAGVETKIDTIDTNVDQIETAVITNAAGTDVAADIIAIKAETVSILADTGELQTDDIPGTLSTIDGKIDTMDANVDQIETAVITNAAGTDVAADIIAIKAETATIVADTGELQTDDYPARFTTLDNYTQATLADTGTAGVQIASAQTVATVTTLTNHTAQSGDSFPLVGAVLDDTGTSGVLIGADAITAASIDDYAILAVNIGTDAIGAAEIAANAIGASELATDAAQEIRTEIDSNSTVLAAILDDTGTSGVAFAANSITAGVIADGAIDAATLAADMDTYQADVEIIDDDTNSTDRYSVTFAKNGEPTLSGITNPKIQVVQDADGADLVAQVSLTEVASEGHYKHNEGTGRITAGLVYKTVVTATIGGSTRTWIRAIGRDN